MFFGNACRRIEGAEEEDDNCAAVAQSIPERYRPIASPTQFPRANIVPMLFCRADAGGVQRGGAAASSSLSSSVPALSPSSSGPGGGRSRRIEEKKKIECICRSRISKIQVPVKTGTCFTYCVRTYVCIPVKDGTHSGFSKYWKPGSVKNSGGIWQGCAT